MLRWLALALLVTTLVEVAPEQGTERLVLAQAQDKPAPQKTPKRDCERNQEGVSA